MIPFIMYNLDKPRKLRMGMTAVVKFEQLTGVKIMSIGDDLSFEVASKMLWVMMTEEESDLQGLSYDEFTRFIDEHANSVSEVIEKATEAMTAGFMGKKEIKNAKTPTKAKS